MGIFKGYMGLGVQGSLKIGSTFSAVPIMRLFFKYVRVST